MATQGNDCRFYYNSTCDKGSRCTFRHSEPARFSTTTCDFWKRGRCTRTNCSYRHSFITKDQKSCCFYENQPGGCTRQNCSYIHERPRHRLQYHEDMSDTHAMGPCLDSRSNSSSSSCSASPSTPTMVNCTSNSIKIAWEEPEEEWEDTCIESYKIGYKEYNKNHSKWAFVDTKNTQTLFTVDGLQGETEYEFKVCAVDDEGNDGPFSFPPTVMSRRPSLGKATNKFAKTKKCFFGTCSMENDEGNAKMGVLDATKKLILVEGNEPVQSMAVEREQEDVINENSTTDHGLNSLDNSAMQKEIQETLKNSAVW